MQTLFSFFKYIFRILETFPIYPQLPSPRLPGDTVPIEFLFLRVT